MNAKEKKTERELCELLMAAIRRYSECDGVTGVLITRSAAEAWDAAFLHSGSAPAFAVEILRVFKTRYELA